MSADWTGNAQSVFTCNGASNHSEGERETNDYYATEPKAVELLMKEEDFHPYVWECACGEGHISEVLKAHAYKVKSSDLYDRGYEGTETMWIVGRTVLNLINQLKPFVTLGTYGKRALRVIPLSSGLID